MAYKSLGVGPYYVAHLEFLLYKHMHRKWKGFLLQGYVKQE